MDPMMMAIGDSSIINIKIFKIRKCRYYPYKVSKSSLSLTTGTMLAMSGAYMAIAIQETAAANAAALALGGIGGKKKKK